LAFRAIEGVEGREGVEVWMRTQWVLDEEEVGPLWLEELSVEGLCQVDRHGVAIRLFRVVLEGQIGRAGR
jgi:hypothetical protein